jgi:hypothetical protein
MAFKFNVGSFLGGVGSGVTAAVDREKAEAWDMKKFNLEQSAADRRIASAEARANSTYMDEARGKLAAYKVPEDEIPGILAKGKGYLEIAFGEAALLRSKNINPAYAFKYGGAGGTDTQLIAPALAAATPIVEATSTNVSTETDSLGTAALPAAVAPDDVEVVSTTEAPTLISTDKGGINFFSLDPDMPESVNTLAKLQDYYYIERTKFAKGTPQYDKLTKQMNTVNDDIQTNAKNAYKAGEVLSTQDAIKVTESYIVSQLQPEGLVESLQDTLKYKIKGGAEPKYIANMNLVIDTLESNFTEDGVYTQPTIGKEVNRITKSLNASIDDYISNTMVKAAQEGATVADKNTYRVFTTPLDHVQFLEELAKLAALTGPEKLLPGTVITYTPMYEGKANKNPDTQIYFPFGDKKTFGKY